MRLLGVLLMLAGLFWYVAYGLNGDWLLLAAAIITNLAQVFLIIATKRRVEADRDPR